MGMKPIVSLVTEVEVVTKVASVAGETTKETCLMDLEVGATSSQLDGHDSTHLGAI